MGGKTLTRADLAESVVQKVGLPRNESQELVELVIKVLSESLAEGRSRQALLVRIVQHPPEGRAGGAQSEDRAGGADHAAARAGVPAEQHHEGSHQRRARTASGGGVAEQSSRVAAG